MRNITPLYKIFSLTFFVLILLSPIFSIDFIKNIGQINNQSVEFYTSFNQGNIYFLKHELMIDLHEYPNHSHNEHKHDESELKSHAYKISFLNANNYSSCLGEEKQASILNYFIGNNPSEWYTDVNKFDRILYRNIYENIDVTYYQKDAFLKYDFIVRPGADISKIALKYEGVHSMKINSAGDLLVSTSVSFITESKPYAYQIIQGKKKSVPCSFLLNNNTLTFNVDTSEYDASIDLIIDPTLIFSSYTGATSDNWGFTATYDNSGNMYVGGIVFSAGYPTTTGAYQTSYGGGNTDMAISKFNASGSTLIYSTYIGGASSEAPHSMMVDNQNNLVIYGTTSSLNYPTTSGCYDSGFNGGNSFSLNGMNYGNGSDIVVTKLNANGNALLGSTFLGGGENDGVNFDNSSNHLHHNYGDEARGEVFIDEQNNIYIASCTKSNNYPVTAGVYLGGDLDGCVTKLSPNLNSLIWSVFVGGSLNDACYSVKVGSNNRVYVVGGTMSQNLITNSSSYKSTYSGGETDGFIISFNQLNGQYVASTYIGTNSYDQCYFIELDDVNDVYVLGQTKGSYPIQNVSYSNPGSAQFIHKLNSQLSGSIFSTLFGDGSRNNVDISPSAFLVDKCGKIYVSGWGGGLSGGNPANSSTNGLPVTPGAIKTTTDGKDFYIIVLEKNASALHYATFFGSNNLGEHVDGGTSRFDKEGNVYQAVCAGCGGSDNFPTTSGVWSPTNGSFNCNLGAVKMKFDHTPVYAYSLVNPDTFSCIVPFTANFSNSSINAISHYWDFGNGIVSTSANPIHTFTTPGTYQVMYIATNLNSCNLKDTNFLQIVVQPPIPPVASFDYSIDCNTNQISVTNTSPVNYNLSWNMGDGSNYYDINNFTHYYPSSGTYTITFINNNNTCLQSDTLKQTILIKPNFQAQITLTPKNYGCVPLQIIFNTNPTAQNYYWDFGNGITQQTLNNSTSYIYTIEGTFNVSVQVEDTNFCNVLSEDSIKVYTSDGSIIFPEFNIEKDCNTLSANINNTTQGLEFYMQSFWEMGDAVSFINNSTTFNYSYGNYGLYTVQLTIEDTLCFISGTAIDTVYLSLVNVEASATPYYGCKPFFTNLSANSNGHNFIWDFGDSSGLSYMQNPAHTYYNGGVFYAVVTAIDSNSCNLFDKDTVKITVGNGIPLLADFEAIQNKDCGKHQVEFINQSQGEISTFFWDLGDGTTSNLEQLTHSYITHGDYVITLFIQDTLCSLNDFVSLPIYVRPGIPVNLPSEKYLCHSDSIIFSTGLDEKYYQHLWSNGATNNQITIFEEGIYSVNITDGYCLKFHQINVQDAVVPNLGGQIEQCYISETIILDIGVEAIKYLWEDGSETKNIQTEEPGEYPFYILDMYECEHESSFIIKAAESGYDVYIPSAFTPNNDNINEVFNAVGLGITYFKMDIFDRWGDVLYTTNSIDNAWDGKILNELLKDEVYVYRLEFENTCTEQNKAVKYGKIVLLK